MKKLTFLFLLLILIYPKANIHAQTLTWQRVNQPGAGLFRSFLSFGNSLFLGGDGRILRSTDDGITWTILNTGLGSSTSYYALAANNTTIFTGSSQGVYRSIDNGTTWSSANTGLPINTSVRSLMVKGTTLFMYGNVGIYRSGDNGSTWQNINLGANSRSLNDYSIIDTVYFSSTGARTIMRFSESGTNWVEIKLQGLAATTLAARGKTLYAGTDGGIFQSNDLGNTWTLLNIGLTTDPVAQFAVSENSIFILQSGSVFRLNDGNSSWVKVSNGVPCSNNLPNCTVSIGSIYINKIGTSLFSIGGEQTMYRANATPTSVNFVSHGSVSREFTINAVMPNPAVTGTIVSYTTTIGEALRFSLVDMLGNTLLSQDIGFISPGTHEIHISANNLPSGKYLFVLSGDGARVSKEVLISK